MNIATYLTNQINNQSIISSTDVIQLTLTLKMTTVQVVETSVTVNNNSPIQDYVHPDDQTQPTFKMTPGFKPFTELHIALRMMKCPHHWLSSINLFSIKAEKLQLLAKKVQRILKDPSPFILDDGCC